MNSILPAGNQRCRNRIFMNIFKKICEPYAEYALRVNMPFEELRKILPELCPEFYPMKLFRGKSRDFFCTVKTEYIKLEPLIWQRNSLRGTVYLRAKEELENQTTVLDICIRPQGYNKTILFFILAISLIIASAASFANHFLALLAPLFVLASHYMMIPLIRKLAEDELPHIQSSLLLLLKKAELRYQTDNGSGTVT